MQQMVFPDMRPGYYRVELEHVPAEGWVVHFTHAEARAFVTSTGRSSYGPMGWHEALQVVGDSLDSASPAGDGQEPF